MSKKERVLALDYGQKRIGVALSDPLGMTAQTRPFISNDTAAIEQVCTLVKEYDVTQIIVGLPLHSDGNESKSAEDVRSFAAALQQEVTVPLEFVDERYSTVAATRQLDNAGLNRKKQRAKIDSQAAAFFLQGYLDRSL